MKEFDFLNQPIERYKYITSQYEYNKELGKFKFPTGFKPDFSGFDNLIFQIQTRLLQYKDYSNLETWVSNIKQSGDKAAIAGWLLLTAASRGKLVSSRLYEKPNLSDHTPPLMQIAKIVDGKPFDDWDINKSSCYQTLGNTFAALWVKYGGRHEEFYNLIGPNTLAEYRERYNNNPRRKINFIPEMGDSVFDRFDQDFKHLLLRTWVYEGSYDYMIYNLDNFDAPGFELGIFDEQKWKVKEKDIYADSGIEKDEPPVWVVLEGPNKSKKRILDKEDNYSDLR